jgi:hypothetical protein
MVAAAKQLQWASDRVCQAVDLATQEPSSMRRITWAVDISRIVRTDVFTAASELLATAAIVLFNGQNEV